ncbi:MAG: gliding motility-associated C-terminal domain-containing protein [Bacteroidales bacterium]|nr:gliding motility-associated C-terminal domain-containing protein [Bacteroidales bacterium]
MRHSVPKSIFKWLPLLLLMLLVSLASAHHRDSLTAEGIAFIPNEGQWNESFLFKASLHGGAVFAEPDCFTFVVLNPDQLKEFYSAKFNAAAPHSGMIDASAYKIRFVGADPNVQVSGGKQLPGYNNYYLGRNTHGWKSQIPKYQEITYHNLYPGIDLNLTQEGAHLKYEFTLAPSASASNIQLDYEGVQNLFVSKGKLVITTEAMQILELQPIAYQLDKNGNRRHVDCKYKVTRRRLTFELGEYDTSLPLVIDPVLIFSSYSGSTADNWGYTATFDKEGNLYAGGNVFDTGYPVTIGSYQVNFGGGSTDIAISKFDSSGRFLHFTTYLGGSGTEVPHSLVVNDNNELYVYGTTSSSDFPVTDGAYDTSFNGGASYVLTSTVHFLHGSDIILTKFNSQGTSLLASTYIGGSANDGLNTVSMLRKNYADEVRGEIIIDGQSNVYLSSSTQSADFPVTAGAWDTTFHGGAQDGCVLKMSHDLSNMIWCTYLGGAMEDAAYSLVLASDNTLFVCGGTASLDLPVTSQVVQPAYGGGDSDGYIARLNAANSQLLQLSYLGKSGYDQTYLVKIDRYNHPHLFGQTNATGYAWIQNAAWHVANGGQFLTKLTPTLDSIVWSTAFGTGNGGFDISPTALLVDLCNNIYMSGWGSHTTNFGQGGTSGLPVTQDAFQMTTDNNDYYFICISDDASQLVYATFFGSPNAREHVDGGTSRFDNKGRIYQAVCAGCGNWDDFPTTPGAWSQTNNSSNCNIGVIKFDFNLPAVVADFNIPNTICAPVNLTFDNTSQKISDSTSFFWDFGDGTTSTQENPSHFYSQSGIYTITLIAQDAGSCNFADTTSHELVVLSNSNSTLSDAGMCIGDYVQIGIPPAGSADITYQWQPQSDLSNPFISNPIANPTQTTTYYLFISDGVCMDTLTQQVMVEHLDLNAGNDTLICYGENITLQPSINGTGISYEWSTRPDFSYIINSDLSQPNITVTPTSTTTYYLRARGNYCESVDEITVELSFFTLMPPDHYVVCYEDSLSISIQVVQPGAYQYAWSPQSSILNGGGSASPLVRPLENTTYTVTVTNEHGCTVTAEVQVDIKRYESNATVTPASCYGSRDGSIVTSISGGESPYVYRWSNGSTTPSITQAAAGTYTLTVTDNTGCKGVDSFLIQQPNPIVLSLASMESVNCDQLCNGSLSITASGGTAPYSYQWLHGDNGSSVSGLCAGFYTVEVTDSHQCPASAIFQVADNSGSDPSYRIRPVSCTGDCDGAIIVENDFSPFGYEIIWNGDSTLTSDSITNLCSGIYNAEIWVENQCHYQLYLQIDPTDALNFLHLYLMPTSCAGETDGSVNIEITGGTEPYSYWVDGNPAEASISGLAPGSHTIEVADANQCRIDTVIEIVSPEPLELSESHVSPPCPEVCAGTLRVGVTGGTLPYRYLWSNNATTPATEHLCVGTYTVTVTDLNNCRAVMEIVLQDSSLFPTEIEAWIDHDTLFAGEHTTLHATDLGQGFSYQWQPPAGVESPHSPTTSITAITTTDYVITVTDEAGCTRTDTVPLIVNDVICEEPYIFVPNAFTPNGDGLNDVLYVRGEVISELKFEIFDRWGEKVFTTTDMTAGWDGKFRGELCEPGVYYYYLQVTCIGQKTFFKKGNVTLLH